MERATARGICASDPFMFEWSIGGGAGQYHMLTRRGWRRM